MLCCLWLKTGLYWLPSCDTNFGWQLVATPSAAVWLASRDPRMFMYIAVVRLLSVLCGEVLRNVTSIYALPCTWMNEFSILLNTEHTSLQALNRTITDETKTENLWRKTTKAQLTFNRRLTKCCHRDSGGRMTHRPIAVMKSRSVNWHLKVICNDFLIVKVNCWSHALI